MHTTSARSSTALTTALLRALLWFTLQWSFSRISVVHCYCEWADGAGQPPGCATLADMIQPWLWTRTLGRVGSWRWLRLQLHHASSLIGAHGSDRGLLVAGLGTTRLE